MTARILRGDVLRFAAHYHGEPFHAMLTDPPYHLYNPVSKRPAGEWNGTRSDPFQRVKGGGFMGKRWDGGDVAFRPDTWAALAELLHPGAFVMAFASARGWHRQAVAMEDAGLIIHPSLFGWSYGSGFPKATRIDTAIDREAGAERKPGIDPYAKNHPNPRGKGVGQIYGDDKNTTGHHSLPATDLARAWAGHRYGLQALKPALEPILVAQKPYRGKPVDSITATGAGAISIDAGRIGTNGSETHSSGVWGGNIYGQYGGKETVIRNIGRWPANFYLQHAPGCKRVGTRRVRGAYSGSGQSHCGDSIFGSGDDHDPIKYTDSNGLETVAAWECVDGCPIRALGEQSGELSSGGKSTKPNGYKSSGIYHDYSAHSTEFHHEKGGLPDRFFFNADWSLDVAEQIDAADPVRYQAKAGRRERDAGLESMPVKPAGAYGEFVGDGRGGQTEHTPARNVHPTVKPIALSRWLSTLLLPPAAYAPRRLLVPFAGVGSEMIGALLAGWDEVIGVEGEAEYVALARARLDWWAEAMRWGHDKVDSILADFAGDEPESVEDSDGNIWQQSSLFDV